MNPDPTAWSMTCDFDAEQNADGLEALVRSCFKEPRSSVRLTARRSWRKRLLSFPWRPLHGWASWSGVAEIRHIKSHDDGTAELVMVSHERIDPLLHIRRPA